MPAGLALANLARGHDGGILGGKASAMQLAPIQQRPANDGEPYLIATRPLVPAFAHGESVDNQNIQTVFHTTPCHLAATGLG